MRCCSFKCASCAASPTAGASAASGASSAFCSLISSAFTARGVRTVTTLFAHLGEAAVDEEPARLLAVADAQLAVAEPADERAPAGQHAQLAVVHRQGDEIDGLVEHRPLGRDDDALQRFVQWDRVAMTYFASLAMRFACFGRFLDAADVHERLLGQVVPLAVAQFLEAADRLGQRRHLALLAGERLGHDERLRQELLDRRARATTCLSSSLSSSTPRMAMMSCSSR